MFSYSHDEEVYGHPQFHPIHHQQPHEQGKEFYDNTQYQGLLLESSPSSSGSSIISNGTCYSIDDLSSDDREDFNIPYYFSEESSPISTTKSIETGYVSTPIRKSYSAQSYPSYGSSPTRLYSPYSNPNPYSGVESVRMQRAQTFSYPSTTISNSDGLLPSFADYTDASFNAAQAALGYEASISTSTITLTPSTPTMQSPKSRGSRSPKSPSGGSARGIHKKQTEPPMVVSSLDKPHPCKVCNKRFKRLEHLRRHARTHSLERPFQCDVVGCKRFFSRSDNLKSHRLTHAKRGGRNLYVPSLEGSHCSL